MHTINMSYSQKGLILLLATLITSISSFIFSANENSKTFPTQLSGQISEKAINDSTGKTTTGKQSSQLKFANVDYEQILKDHNTVLVIGGVFVVILISILSLLSMKINRDTEEEKKEKKNKQ